MSTDQLATVNTLLAAAGVDPSAAERETLTEMYAMFKGGVELIHAMPEARYEVPALVFEADPELTEW
ncbi:MAG: hypothetical protein AAGC46_00180 [Solirubrobacteraceae bacterium]|nr:hypothetical protein [Patulibacter sp.]